MEPRIRYTYPIFQDQMEPIGRLTRDIRCHACWYFYVLAQKQKANVGDSIDDQIILEGELWLDKHYEQTARSVAIIYGLTDPSEFMQFWPYVSMECQRLGMTPPAEEYMRPVRLLS